MKIAFVEWSPRVCGVVEVLEHWCRGAGGTLVAFSKSGNPLNRWGPKGHEGWTVIRERDAIEYLNTFHLVIFSDITCRSRDDSVNRRAIVEGMKTPWTTMIHDGQYQEKHDEEIAWMLGSESFSGVLVTTRPEQITPRFTRFPKFNQSKLVTHPYLPYDVSTDNVNVPRRTRDFIMTSRIATNKGHPVALNLLPDLAGSIHVWGNSSYGLPSTAWALWELGLTFGYRPVLTPRATNNSKIVTANRFSTGEFVLRKGSHVFHYHGGYRTKADVDWSPWFSPSFTNDTLRGSLEMMTLDAIASGSIAIVPEAQVPKGRYKSLITIPYGTASWTPKGVLRRNDWHRDSIVGQLNFLATNYSEGDLFKIWHAQYQELEVKHNPKQFHRKVLRAL